MTFIQKLDLYDRMHLLICRRGTGSADQLASRLGVSQRTIYNMINTLQEYGASIKFCRRSHSFYYARYLPFRFSPLPNPDFNI